MQSEHSVAADGGDGGPLAAHLRWWLQHLRGPHSGRAQRLLVWLRGSKARGCSENIISPSMLPVQ